MQTPEDVFCAHFFRWWKDQTIPFQMTFEKASSLFANCQTEMKGKLAGKMLPDVYEECMATAHKVMLFGASWTEAKKKRMDELQGLYKVPRK